MCNKSRFHPCFMPGIDYTGVFPGWFLTSIFLKNKLIVWEDYLPDVNLAYNLYALPAKNYSSLQCEHLSI
ncbi:hypothetical protein JW964_00925, partial [candidate division KSB1 bacterium]|nr:hypothetical protein [candidate division KSB1 bacterium]